MAYIQYYPSGKLFLDGIQIPVDDNTPEFQAYLAWRALGNAPDLEPDPYVAPVTATIARIATAMEQLGIVTPTIDDMTNRIFPLAITL